MASKDASRCQVDRCIFRAYTHHRVCKAHSIASTAIVGGVAQRFCYYCGEFHLLLEFNENSICRRLLADKDLSLGQSQVSSSSSIEDEIEEQCDTVEPPEESDVMPPPTTHVTTLNWPVPTLEQHISEELPSAAGEGSSSSTQQSLYDRLLCEAIEPGSEMTNFLCPDCHGGLLLCLDGSYQCGRPSCWSRWTI